MKSNVELPAWLASLMVAALITLQGWMLKEISALKVSVAGISARIELLAGPNRIAQK